MRRARIILFSMVFFLPFGAGAANLDFNLSDDAAAVRYTVGVTDGGAQVDYGLLYQDDSVYVPSLGLHLVDNAGTERQPVRVGLGGRLLYVDTNGPSGAAIAIGAFGRFSVPNADRFAIAANLYMAPNVIAFGDLDKYLEYGVRGEYEVLRNAALYLGYRRVRINIEGAGNATLDKGLHFGMNFTF